MTVQSPMLDKENTTNRHEPAHLQATKKPSVQQPKTPLRKTPLRRRQPLQSTTPQQQRRAPLTPPGSSKVLRQHFQQLTVTPHRTKIQSGAVRVQQSKKKTTTQPHHSPCRIGYDGTSKTPSKQLLKSTACSRSHQVPHHHHYHHHEHHDNDSVMTQEVKRRPSRDECFDPVALTLLNDDDGKENVSKLIEQDVSVPSPPALQKVSSNLEDVLNQETVATLVRPVPKVARM